MPFRMGPLKRAFLQLLDERGYVLLKKPEYLQLAAKNAAETEPPKELAPAVEPQAIRMPEPEFQGTGPASSNFVEKAEALLGPLPGHARAIFDAVEYIVKNRIPGDIVDCGEGEATNLSLVALALLSLGDEARRLVLFDVTADARHRPETRLELWGADLSDIVDEHIAKRVIRLRREQPIPDEISRTGYPLGGISIARIPDATIDFSRPVALLIAIPDTYDSNKAAVSRLIPQITSGGVLAVYGGQGLRACLPGCVQFGIDFVGEFLQEKGVSPLFRHVSESFRMAVMP